MRWYIKNTKRKFCFAISQLFLATKQNQENKKQSNTLQKRNPQWTINIIIKTPICIQPKKKKTSKLANTHSLYLLIYLYQKIKRREWMRIPTVVSGSKQNQYFLRPKKKKKHMHANKYIAKNFMGYTWEWDNSS